MGHNTTDNYLITINSTVDQATNTDAVDLFIEVLCNRYIAPVICGIGIIGNIINYIVLSNRRLKKGSYLYLKALTLFDLMALLFSIPYMLVGVGSADYFWVWFSVYIFLPMVNFFTACSVWTTVVMAIDRFIFVKCPAWSRRKNWKLKTQIKIFAVITLAIIICVPKFFCYEIIEDGPTTRIRDSEFRHSLFFRFTEILSTGALHFVPLLILSVINVYLVRKLQSAREVKREMSLTTEHETEWQKSQQIFTVTLVSIVVLSIIFILPASIVDIFLYIDPNFPHQRSMRNLSNLLLWCNLSFNCFLYCIFNRQFLRVLRSVIYRGCDRVRRSPTRSTDFQMA